jgi:hypothetical protein
MARLVLQELAVAVQSNDSQAQQDLVDSHIPNLPLSQQPATQELLQLAHTAHKGEQLRPCCLPHHSSHHTSMTSHMAGRLGA